MEDALLVAVRFALYAELGLLFGMPLFALYALRGPERGDYPFRTLLGVLAGAGAALSLLGFLSMAGAMTGTGLAGVDRDTLTMLVSETPVGWAFIAREAALILVLLLSLWPPRNPVTFLTLAIAMAGIAVASLAWSGHGAADEGAAGLVHLASDIVHLLATSAWLGALVMLAIMVSPRREATAGQIVTSCRALAGFATVGSILVGLIIATGIVNSAFLVGVDNLWSLGTNAYGRLLLAKLGLFALMLGLAAGNRFFLVPALASKLGEGSSAPAFFALRRSLLVETLSALAILALVAWLGTLAPPLSGG